MRTLRGGSPARSPMMPTTALSITSRSVRGVAFAIFFCCQLFSAFAAPHPRTKSISIAAVQQLKAPLTLEAVERAFGPATGQPGPRVSYPCADHKGMSLWFWYWRPQRPGNVSHAEVIVGCVILATTETEEKQKVIWPPDSVNAGPEKLTREVNKRYEKRE